MQFTKQLPFNSRIIPVVEINDADKAVALVDALTAGGIDVIEVTLRTDQAINAIALITKERPSMHVAAGTVLNEKQLNAVITAGAKLAFSPGSPLRLLQAAKTSGIRFIPGIASATEVMNCMDEGFNIMKVFPADAMNALKLIKALGSPLQAARFIPTGGVSEANVLDFFALKNIVAVGGSSVAPKDLIDQSNWAEITTRARRLVQLITV